MQLVSKTHRQALKLDAVHFSTSFRLEETTILAEVQQSAQPQPGHVTARLQAVNVYGLGDFFKEHKDCAIADDSFGTLVVGLPSSYTGKLRILSLEHDAEKSKEKKKGGGVY